MKSHSRISSRFHDRPSVDVRWLHEPAAKRSNVELYRPDSGGSGMSAARPARLCFIRKGVWARAKTTAATSTTTLNTAQVSALWVRRMISLERAQAHQNTP